MYLSQEINHSNLLGNLERKIFAFHNSHNQELHNIREDIHDTRITMESMKSMLDQRLLNASPSPGYAGLNGVMPSNTRIFHGREKLVNKLAAILTQGSEKRKRICIMGPGGMGKTSTALAIVAHPDVKNSFPDRSQIWVPCWNATSIYLFLETLCLSLGIKGRSVNPLKDIIETLNLSKPLILLLDNFETPWNIDDAQARSQVEDILRSIEDIPHIALLVTMRSSSPPSEGHIAWYPLDLRAVDRDAALQIYLDTYGEANGSLRDDPDLARLLEMIGYMPLAITLMAKAAKLTGLSAEKLIEKYEERGTAMLGASGTDAKHNMDSCISLSVDSAPMKRVPEAFRLLGALAMLPVGATFETLDALWAQNYSDLMLAVETLRDTSLLDQQGSTYLVLPVIRRYILKASRFPKTVRNSLVDAACRFLDEHQIDLRVNGEFYVKHVKAIASEEANLQAVLLETTVPTPSLIKALITLARHQEATSPRTEVIEHALKLLEDLENNTELLGLALKCQADILLRQNLSEKVSAPLIRARDLFLSIANRREVAECILRIANVQRYFSDDYPRPGREALIAEAQANFESVKDRYGVGLCLFEYGHVYTQDSEFSQAIEVYNHAREIFVEFNDLPRMADVAYQIANALYSDNKPERARMWAETAIKQSKDIGRHDMAQTRLLGRILIKQGAFDEAVKEMATCLQQIRGGRQSVAAMLEEIGRAWAKMGKKEDAQGAFQESISYLSGTTAHDREGRIRCEFFIRALLDPQAQPSQDELYALEGWHTFDNFEELL
ncbi:hypothetical protein H0H81_009067 [Sphagnurus paluster]|uniref:Uncharacterized protein n=1 Tax=Sphagnurus paluster TaxID=117069 RepID=A0A9P7KIK8_9AGAR|nr:hypothetical protein H0H81_009067 [Sphagnurus paluster]